MQALYISIVLYIYPPNPAFVFVFAHGTGEGGFCMLYAYIVMHALCLFYQRLSCETQV